MAVGHLRIVKWLHPIGGGQAARQRMSKPLPLNAWPETRENGRAYFPLSQPLLLAGSMNNGPAEPTPQEKYTVSIIQHLHF